MNNDKIKVTIAIPAYKPDYLNLSIASALNQTYQNIEVVVVNDKSPYDIKSIVESFHDNRLRYCENDYNLGAGDPSKNWNRCVEVATGDFFCLLCDDDTYDSCFVETMLLLATKYPEVDVFRSGVKIVNGNQEVIGYYASSPEFERVPDYMWHVFNSLRRQSISEFFHRIDNIKKIKYFNAPLAWDVDYVSIYKLALSNGIVSSSKRLVNFRFSDVNISSDNKTIALKLLAKNICMSEVIELINEDTCNDKTLLLKAAYRHHELSKIWHVSYAPWYVLLLFLIRRKRYKLSYVHLLKGLIKKILNNV